MENVLLSAGVSFVAAIIASYIGSRAALKSTKMNVEVSTRTMLLNNAVKCAEIEYGAVVKASMESKTDLKPSPFNRYVFYYLALLYELRGCPACFLILKGVVISSHETNRFS